MWNQGERIRVAIVDVTKTRKGSRSRFRRASSELIKRLFEMEVPEIYDDTVVINRPCVSRGSSQDRGRVERKGRRSGRCCVGMKGSRVQSIIKELRGEKIDIIEWSDETVRFRCERAFAGKSFSGRITDINKRKMEVIVRKIS
jgi:N utilization substance protein A